jgi:hypothetical protein
MGKNRLVSAGGGEGWLSVPLRRVCVAANHEHWYDLACGAGTRVSRWMCVAVPTRTEHTDRGQTGVFGKQAIEHMRAALGGASRAFLAHLLAWRSK